MADPGNGGAPRATCPSCGFENPPATLYCQDCGTKLEVPPPSYLAAAPVTTTGPIGSAPAPAPAPTMPGRRPRILSTRRVGQPGLLGITVRVLIYAAFVALVIQMVRPPRNLPPAPPPLDGATVDAVRESLALTAQAGRTVDAPWDRVNSYLAGTLAGNGKGGPVRFVRAYAQPEGGNFVLGLVRQLGPVPVVTSVAYAVVPRSNGLTLEPTGAAVGRIPLPGWAAPVVQMLNSNLASSLEFEAQILREAKSVRISPANAFVDFSRSPR